MRELLFPLIAVAAAFLVGGVLVLLVGDSPLRTYELLIGSALSWPDGIGYTLFYATPLIFTGLAVAVAFRCGLLNIGAEGQLYVAAFATAWVGITFAGLAGRGCWCRCACSPRSSPARSGGRSRACSRRGSERTK